MNPLKFIFLENWLRTLYWSFFEYATTPLVDWPLPLVPGPAGNHCGECHSLGCNVHSSHMLLWDQIQSKAAGCHPAEYTKRGVSVTRVSWQFHDSIRNTQLILEIIIIYLQKLIKPDQRRHGCAGILRGRSCLILLTQAHILGVVA